MAKRWRITRPSLGDDMAMRAPCRCADGGDVDPCRARTARKLTYLADIKGAASVAHIYGQNLVAAESLTAIDEPVELCARTTSSG